MEAVALNRLNWPDDYLSAIEQVLKGVPEVEELIALMNTSFEVYERIDGKRASKTITGDSTTIFGGFLRWIVEEVSSGRDPTLSEFIKYGGDIDIAIDDYTGAVTKLIKFFQDVISRGGAIEYVGMAYGDSYPQTCNFKLDEKTTLLYGNYIVWVPLIDNDTLATKLHFDKPKTKKQQCPVEVVETPKIVINNHALVKEGVTFASALKSVPIAENKRVVARSNSMSRLSAVATASKSIDKTGDDTKSGDGKVGKNKTGADGTDKYTASNNTITVDERRWIKLDINYGSRPLNTDFTANMLQWPKKMASATSMQAIKDIIGRRIVPTSCTYTVKNCYRLIKLYRRGYDFGIGDSSDMLVLKEYLVMACPDRRRSRRQQNRSREIFGLAFTGDMSSPSMCPSKNIRTTKHALTELTAQYVSSLPEYKALAARVGINVSSVSSIGLSKKSGSDTDAFSNDIEDTEDIENPEPTKYIEPNVEVTTAPMRAYKMAEVWLGGCNVCIALDIPVGTRYVNNGNVFRFEEAEIAGLYTYPFVRVNDLVQRNQLTIVSNHDKNFIYVKEGEIKQIVHAQNGVNVTRIGKNDQFGIYAYKTLIEAWGHYGTTGHLETLLRTKC